MEFPNTPHYYNALIKKLKTINGGYSVKCSRYGFLIISCTPEELENVQTFCNDLEMHPDDYAIQSF
jgi:hypothetical protein